MLTEVRKKLPERPFKAEVAGVPNGRRPRTDRFPWYNKAKGNRLICGFFKPTKDGVPLEKDRPIFSNGTSHPRPYEASPFANVQGVSNKHDRNLLYDGSDIPKL